MLFKLNISLLLIFNNLLCLAQIFEENEQKYGPGKVYIFTENKASFPGGQKEMNEFFNLYFDAHAENGSFLEGAIEGYVEAKFIVETNGKVKYVEIIKSYTPAYDEEMIKTLLKMPKWKPATLDGVPVRSFSTYRYSLKFYMH